MTRPEDATSWLPLCETIAREFVPKAVRKAEQSRGWFNSPAGAEFDDLVQVGQEEVIKVLGMGMYPTKTIIKHALNNHLRVVFKQRGETNV